MIFKSSSSARTRSFARRVARAILRRHVARSATVVALKGELGSGKTTFVQGFARAIGAHGRVASPTFVIIRRMAIKRKAKSEKRKVSGQLITRRLPFVNLYHVDAYRLKNTRELRNLELGDILHNPHNMVLIEWPERIRSILPKSAVRVTFHHGKREHERTIKLLGVSF